MESFESIEYMLYGLIGLWAFFMLATAYVVSAKIRFWQRDFRPSIFTRVLQLIANLWSKVWN